MGLTVFFTNFAAFSFFCSRQTNIRQQDKISGLNNSSVNITVWSRDLES